MKNYVTKKSIVIFSIFSTAAFLIFCCSMPGLAQAKAQGAGGNGGGKAVSPSLHSPTRLDFTPEGNLLVSDYRLRMILTVNSKTLEVKNWFEVDGRPVATAWAKGRILVGNEVTRCIETYTRSGKKQGIIGGGNHPIYLPQDIAVDSEAEILFAVDGGDKNVKVFSLKGDFIGYIPAEGTDPDHSLLANPTAAALDMVNRWVYVSDYGDTGRGIYPRVQVFDYEGNLTYTISGKAGMFGQRFSRPQGLALNDSGQLFLLDCFAGEILILDPGTGELLKTMAGFGSEPGQLQLPLDLVIDKKTNDIYVTNNRAARIERFGKGGVL